MLFRSTFSIVDVHNIIEHLSGAEIDGQTVLTAELTAQMRTYLRTYGPKDLKL